MKAHSVTCGVKTQSSVGAKGDAFSRSGLLDLFLGQGRSEWQTIVLSVGVQRVVKRDPRPRGI